MIEMAHVFNVQYIYYIMIMSKHKREKRTSYPLARFPAMQCVLSERFGIQFITEVGNVQDNLNNWEKMEGKNQTKKKKIQTGM